MNAEELNDSLAVLAGSLVHFIHRPSEERCNAIQSLIAVLLGCDAADLLVKAKGK